MMEAELVSELMTGGEGGRERSEKGSRKGGGREEGKGGMEREEGREGGSEWR